MPKVVIRKPLHISPPMPYTSGIFILEDVMKTFKPLLFLGCFVLVVGLACAALGNGGTPLPPAQPPTQAPQQQQPPTQPPPTESSQPTEPPVTQGQQFFTEEFDSNDNWSYIVMDGAR